MEQFQDITTPSFSDFSKQYQSPWQPGIMSQSKLNDLRNTWNQMYYPNAFQAAMLNYQNEWQSPKNQMLRYQEAGLNPYSFQAQSSASGTQGSKPEPQFGYQELSQQKISNALKGASTVSQVMGVAKDIYDYIRFGKDRSFYQTATASYQAGAAQAAERSKVAQATWDEYWNTGQEFEVPAGSMAKTPRGLYMENSTKRLEAQIDQLEYLTKFLYPSQKDLNDARKALTDYQKQIAEGRYDAVLNINTGNKTADTILRMISMWLLQTSLSLRP